MKKPVMRRREDEGFTLIELMVVVLIMGILMAIAIPTFLGARSSANDASAQSNATNVATSELAYQANNSTFVASGDGTKLDSSIPWVTGGATANKVDVFVGSAFSSATADAAGTSGNVMIVESEAANSDCFIVFADETGNGVVGYQVTTGGCPPAASVAALTEPTVANITGNGAGAAKTANRIAYTSASYASNAKWYTTW